MDFVHAGFGSPLDGDMPVRMEEAEDIDAEFGGEAQKRGALLVGDGSEEMVSSAVK